MRSDDHHLLQRFVDDRSEAAFTELVQRHVDLVYSTARRLVGGDRHLAQDVTQTVFADLARKAARLVDHPAPAGWLHRHTFFVASGLVRAEHRRKRRERESIDMNAAVTTEAAWSLVEGNLDEALNRLGEADRHAIVLRFFEKQDLRTVGKALGVGEDAAQKRVGRALEKLRAILQRRGVNLSAALLAPALAGHAVTAAPALLAGAVTTAVMSGSAAGTGLLFTLNTLNKLLSMNSIKIVGSIALAAVVATPIVAQQRTITGLRTENAALTQQIDALASLQDELDRLRSQAIDPAELARLREDHRDLLRLRGELTAVRSERSPESQVEQEIGALPEPEATSEEEDVEPAILLTARFVELPRNSRLWTDFNLPAAERGGTSPMSPEQLKKFTEACEAETEAGVKIMAAPRITNTRNKSATLSQTKIENVIVGYENDSTPIYEAIHCGVTFNAKTRPFGEWNVLELELSASQKEFLGYVNDDPSTARPIISTVEFPKRTVQVNLGDSVVVVGGKASLNEPGVSPSPDHPGVIAVITPSLVVSKVQPFDPNDELAAPEQVETPTQ